MRLTKLEIHGFKSFADHTQLVFEPGATMIVGPNGCGKSNVSDSVRWVLGEQRARVMRGGSMQDIIFQGSSARRPVNVAEVSLHFDNADGTLPVPFQEVVITRRLSRSGESEYFLNRAPCRLRDIQDLVRGTGLGAESGVVIESKMIDALLSDRPDDRRELFEEAAGVGLYRDRRRSTERRLEETAADLQRIDDLVNEVQSQVRSLARQRKRAERSVELSARRFNVELTLAAREMAAWKDELERLEARVADLREQTPGMTDLVDEAEQRREAAAGMRAAAEARRAELARLVAEQRQGTLQLQGEIAVAEERQRNAAQRRERAESERMEHAQAEVRVRDEQAAAAAERAALEEAVAAAAEQLAQRQAMEEEARAAVAAARQGVEQADRRVRETRDVLRRHEMDREGAQREMTELTLRLERLEEERGTVSDAVAAVLREAQEADEVLEMARVAQREAQEALDQARIRAREARDADAAARAELFRADEAHTSLQGKVNALETLERERVGLAPAAARLLEVREQFGEGAIVGPVADFITAGTEAALLVERFLGNTVNAILVRDREAAELVRVWHLEAQPGPLLLLPLDALPESDSDEYFGPPEHDVLLEKVETLGAGRAWVRALLGHAHAIDDGAAFVDARGAMFLPGSVGGPGPLRRRAELAALRDELRATHEGRLAASAAADFAREALLQADRAATAAGDAASAAAQETRHAEEKRAELERRRQRAERELNEANALAERLAERRGDLAERIAAITEQAEGVREQLAQAEAEASGTRAAIEGAERLQDEAREARTVQQVEQAQAQARLQVAADRERRLGEELTMAATRMESLARELATLGESDVQLAEQMADWKLDLETRQATLQDAEGFLVEAEQGVKTAYETLEDAETMLADVRRRSGALGEELHTAQLRWTDLNGRRTAIRGRLETEWRKPMEDLLQSYDPVELDDDSLRAEAEQLREQLEQLGPINPLAVEEHEEEMKRLDFLTTQRSDLAEARLALQQAIREIDTTARELFIATFHQVRENFRQIFMTLFGGGECDIKLENPDAPLDCDIEIHASPRGKRTQRIHLLSSGERALVACSLLFGIFLTRPSPFCLLDEVDAPLDDQNVGRFVRMLNQFKERTQFIVITHNPRTTTEAADAVYGVTMQEPGVSSIVSVRMKGGAVEEAIAGNLVGAGA